MSLAAMLTCLLLTDMGGSTYILVDSPYIIYISYIYLILFNSPRVFHIAERFSILKGQLSSSSSP